MKITRLLFVVDDLVINSGQSCQLKQLINRLPSSKFDVHVATFCNVGDGDVAPDISATIHQFNRRQTVPSQYFNLRRLVKQLVPDITHAWGYQSHLAVAIAQSGLKIGRTIYSYFCAPPNRLMLQRWLEEAYSGPPSVVTASHSSIVERLVADGFEQPFQIVPNCHQPVDSDPRKTRQKLMQLAGLNNENIFIAGTVGRMDPRFRMKDLIWATDLICCVRDDVHLLIIGHGTGKPGLKRFLSKTEASGHVHFIDSRAIETRDLSGLDAYWNSQIEEPNPPMMLNCMAQRVPAISVVDEATADVIIPMRSGLGTNFGARDEFARWTKFLIEQKERSKQLAAQGREHVERAFPVQKMVDGFLELYSSTR